MGSFGFGSRSKTPYKVHDASEVRGGDKRFQAQSTRRLQTGHGMLARLAARHRSQTPGYSVRAQTTGETSIGHRESIEIFPECHQKPNAYPKTTSLFWRQAPFEGPFLGARHRLPYITPVVFVSAPMDDASKPSNNNIEHAQKL